MTAAPERCSEKASRQESVSTITLEALCTLDKQHMLCKSAWGLCTALRTKNWVQLNLSPLNPPLQTAARIVASKEVTGLTLSGSFTDDILHRICGMVRGRLPTSDPDIQFDNLFNSVAVMTMQDFSGPMLRFPQALQSLDITRCPDLTALLESIGELALLRTLVIKKCEGLATLTASMCQLAALHRAAKQHRRAGSIERAYSCGVQGPAGQHRQTSGVNDACSHWVRPHSAAGQHWPAGSSRDAYNRFGEAERAAGQHRPVRGIEGIYPHKL